MVLAHVVGLAGIRRLAGASGVLVLQLVVRGSPAVVLVVGRVQVAVLVSWVVLASALVVGPVVFRPQVEDWVRSRLLRALVQLGRRIRASSHRLRAMMLRGSRR